ncbi:MAG: hypothetical protein L6290_06245 [Thermodesulfovibrionales bacterium]|nr:hypothetical protein [Thermodesulfovibrionales bacterium]
MKAIMLRTLLVVLFLCLFVNVGFAEQLVSPSGGQYVLVFKTEDLLDYAIRHISSGGSAFEPTYVDTVRAMVESGTACSVIKRKSGKRQVRILSGVHKGAIGWVPFEMVQ